ncbi:uncharacterized protein [Nothobranchius furzeri]|uniref:uncharacterized protein n=1 Tax=Nothobranchius furzeri TaxID=105023 RepID=UPI003904A277
MNCVCGFDKNQLFFCVRVGVSGEQLPSICSSVVRGFKERRDNSSVPDDYSFVFISRKPRFPVLTCPVSSDLLRNFSSTSQPPSSRNRLIGFKPCLPAPSLATDRLLSNPHLPTWTSRTLLPLLPLTRPAQPALTYPPLKAFSNNLETNSTGTTRTPTFIFTSTVQKKLFTYLLPLCVILHVVGQKATTQHDSLVFNLFRK